MDNLNRFFRRLYTSPSLIWKVSASVLFVIISIIMFFTYGTRDSMIMAFSGLLLVYGLFRFYTFYREYKEDDE